MTALFISAWSTGADGFIPDYGNIFANVSPWALTFYSITLLGSTLHTFWPRLKDHAGLGVAMIVVALAVGVYAGFIAVWRHDNTFVPGVSVYVVTLILLVVTIILCYVSYSKTSGP